jgi:hypothetical protein
MAGDQTSRSASKSGFITEIDFRAGSSHVPSHENDVSGRSQRACAHTARKAISYPSLAEIATEKVIAMYRAASGSQMKRNAQ